MGMQMLTWLHFLASCNELKDLRELKDKDKSQQITASSSLSQRARTINLTVTQSVLFFLLLHYLIICTAVHHEHSQRATRATWPILTLRPWRSSSRN